MQSKKLTPQASKLLQYWRDCLTYFELNGLDDVRSKESFAITKQELQQAQLSESLIEKLKFQPDETATIFIAPCCLSIKNQYNHQPQRIYPMWLTAKIATDGSITANSPLVWPWIAPRFLEPIATGVSIGDLTAYHNLLSLTIPPWNDKVENATWQQVLSYAKQVLQILLTQTGYVASDIVDNDDAIIIAGNSAELKKHLQVYEQLKTGEKIPQLIDLLLNNKQPLKADYSGNLPEDEQNSVIEWLNVVKKSHEKSHKDTNFANIIINLSKGNAAAIKVLQGFISHNYDAQIVVEAILNKWVAAAVRQDKAAINLIATSNGLKSSKIADFANAFLYDGNDTLLKRWLPMDGGLELLLCSRKNSREQNVGSINFIKKKGRLYTGLPEVVEQSDFLESATEEFLDNVACHFTKSVDTIEQSISIIWQQLKQTIKDVNLQLQAAEDAAALLKELDLEYKRHGGFSPRFEQVSADFLAKKERHNSSAAILNAWVKILTSKTVFERFGYILPGAKARKLKQDLALLKKKTKCKLLPKFTTHKKYTSYFIEQFKNNKKQFETSNKVFTTVNNDWQRLALIWERLAVISAKNNIYKGKDSTAVVCDELLQRMKKQIYAYAQHYWEAKWLQQMVLLQEKVNVDDDIWQRYAMLTPVITANYKVIAEYFGDYSDNQKWKANLEAIDNLFVVDAENLSPSFIPSMFAFAKKAIIVGDSHKFANNFAIAPVIDHHLLTANTLAEDDEEYADLEYKGVLANNGSILLAAESAVDKTKSITRQLNINSQIFTVLKQFAYEHININEQELDHNDTIFTGLKIINVNGKSEKINGSLANHDEVAQVLHLLKFLQQKYKVNLEEDVAIVTPFYAQANVIKAELKKHNLQTTVSTMACARDVCRKNIVLSSVNVATDERPYPTDQYHNLVVTMIANATDSFIVVGDSNIWATRLTTATARVARLLQPFSLQLQEYEAAIA